VAVFASDSANLEVCLRLADRRPDLLRIATVVSDVPGGRSSRLAQAARIRCIERPFAKLVGRASDCTDDASYAAYQQRAVAFHDEIGDRLAEEEERDGPLRALVFSYSRWVHGRLLSRYQGRIINQHPGDLTRMDARRRRRLAGFRPTLAALRSGDPAVRTSTFLIDEGHDTGSILAQGPVVGTARYQATTEGAQAARQTMKWASDPPSLICALLLMLRSTVGYGPDLYPDGSRQLLVDGRALPFGGIDAGELRAGHRQGLPPDVADLIAGQLRADARQLADAERRPYAHVR
jgi:folate-dependent phosphoribosylglycinamide formyltransferase PurN